MHEVTQKKIPPSGGLQLSLVHLTVLTSLAIFVLQYLTGVKYKYEVFWVKISSHAEDLRLASAYLRTCFKSPNMGSDIETHTNNRLYRCRILALAVMCYAWSDSGCLPYHQRYLVPATISCYTDKFSSFFVFQTFTRWLGIQPLFPSKALIPTNDFGACSLGLHTGTDIDVCSNESSPLSEPALSGSGHIRGDTGLNRPIY